MTALTGGQPQGGGSAWAMLALIFLGLAVAVALLLGTLTPPLSPTPAIDLQGLDYRTHLLDWQYRRPENFQVVALEIVNNNNGHALKKHGAIAQTIVDACKGNGPAQVWRSVSWRHPDKYYLGCELPDGQLGLWVVQCTKRGWMWVTSFLPGNGSEQAFVEYVAARAKPYVDVLPHCGG